MIVCVRAAGVRPEEGVLFLHADGRRTGSVGRNTTRGALDPRAARRDGRGGRVGGGARGRGRRT